MTETYWLQGLVGMVEESVRSRFYGGLEQTTAARDWIGTYLRGAGLHPQEVEAWELAITEAAGNILRHAYNGRYPTAFEVEVSLTDEVVTVVLVDEGRPFSPADEPAPDPDALNERGYGLFLIQSLMDEVEYTPAKGGTTLRLVGRRRPQADDSI